MQSPAGFASYPAGPRRGARTYAVRVPVPRSYLICGTPRTGSTLLCSLLTSTGVLGRPESYFRESDEARWAQRFGLAVAGPRVVDYSALVRAARAAGTSENGVFAARIMWGSLDRVVAQLSAGPPASDLEALERAFGPLAFVHLQRRDVVGQAVSWCRAEQTGYWQDGDVASAAPTSDLTQMSELLETIAAHNVAWREWFREQAIEPLTITYEALIEHPGVVIEKIAGLLDVSIPNSWQPKAPQRQQADDLNTEWATALRAALEK